MSELFSEFIKSAHKHPLYCLGLTIVVIAYISYSFNAFARIVDTENINKKVDKMYLSFQRYQKEQIIYDRESEISDIERIVANGNARNDDFERLSKIKSELGKAKRDLNMLMPAH